MPAGVVSRCRKAQAGPEPQGNLHSDEYAPFEEPTSSKSLPSPRGIDAPLEVQERLANIISAGIRAPLMPAVEVLQFPPVPVDTCNRMWYYSGMITRAVLDTNVLVSGLCRHSGSDTYEIVRTIGLKWHMAATPQIFLEYQDVLLRPRIRKLTGLSASETNAVLDYIADVAERTAMYYYWRPNLEDESDNKFVECAVACDAQFIVTGNKADLERSQLGPFRFDLVGPREFVKRIG